jgi:hypothetical protein
MVWDGIPHKGSRNPAERGAGVNQPNSTMTSARSFILRTPLPAP